VLHLLERAKIIMINKYRIALPIERSSQFEISPTLVLPGSRLSLRRHVEEFAIYFKRELRYDLQQFSVSDTHIDPDFVPWEAFLFHEIADDLWKDNISIPMRFLGACCFRLRDVEDGESQWNLDWAWLHPYLRGRGLMSKAWPTFSHRYPNFAIEPPISSGMKALLNKMRPNPSQA
jgi:hypothetical protein